MLFDNVTVHKIQYALTAVRDTNYIWNFVRRSYDYRQVAAYKFRLILCSSKKRKFHMSEVWLMFLAALTSRFQIVSQFYTAIQHVLFALLLLSLHSPNVECFHLLQLVIYSLMKQISTFSSSSSMGTFAFFVRTQIACRQCMFGLLTGWARNHFRCFIISFEFLESLFDNAGLDEEALKESLYAIGISVWVTGAT
ncbi:hypothetical protein BDF20DRAFT_932367 [Mycotypha africana]|uniref:uncharacterized protein n=1 Tax=Mycotypha africana TaxID=64632 RepID=UPI0023016A60|nr:uncharacterized protein BDF20DRAFT_932367 [Mycotypha africana]KAI8988450.1 hypothetical protein BDF20DRAFT_932367 [Mycotypha africana]